MTSTRNQRVSLTEDEEESDVDDIDVEKEFGHWLDQLETASNVISD